MVEALKRFVVFWLALYVVPMTLLLRTIAVFQVETPFNLEHMQWIENITSHLPVYAEYAHALSSLRLIAYIGFLLCLILLPFYMTRKMSLATVSLLAVGIGFFSAYGLWRLNYMRFINQDAVGHLSRLAGAAVFALVYGAVALAVAWLLRKLLRENRKAIRLGSAAEAEQE